MTMKWLRRVLAIVLVVVGLYLAIFGQRLGTLRTRPPRRLHLG